MATTKPDRTATRRYGDYEVITPPNRLKGAIGSAIDGDDPVARAEAALAQLSSEFDGWMNDECERLDRARQDVRQNGMTAQPREALFRAAHDIKGQAATLGFPLVASVAESLCRLIDETPDPRRVPLDLVDQHVDAVRAIIREHGHAQAEAVAERLTRTLRKVSADFLAAQGVK
jgi:chemotaxis protein histidine kinase CheA